MSKIDLTNFPLGYTVTEVANYFGVSRTECLRRVHSGVIPAQRYGNFLLIPSTALVELIARSLPPDDERYKVQAEVDEMVNTEHTERAHEQARERAERADPLFLARKREAAAAEARRVRDADPNTGTRRIRETLRRLNDGKERVGVRIEQYTDTIPADQVKAPAYARGPGGRICLGSRWQTGLTLPLACRGMRYHAYPT